MIRELTSAEVREMLGRTGMLRTYTIRMHVVAHVDNEGAQCNFCGSEGAVIAANVYAKTFAGNFECADTCMSCALSVVDGEIDTDPSYPVTIEFV